jgi:hypothetical protein
LDEPRAHLLARPVGADVDGDQRLPQPRGVGTRAPGRLRQGRVLIALHADRGSQAHGQRSTGGRNWVRSAAWLRASRAGRTGSCLTPLLLHHMGQFMGDQASPGLRSGRELAGAEDDVRANRERPRPGVVRSVPGLRVGMHAYVREIVAEVPPHLRPQERIERPAGGGSQRGREGRPGRRRRFGRLARAGVGLRAAGFEPRGRSRDLVGHPLRFPFERITGLADREARFAASWTSAAAGTPGPSRQRSRTPCGARHGAFDRGRARPRR